MVQRSGGFRRNTRSKLRKAVSERGKLKIRRYLRSFEVGDRVTFTAEPSVQGGMHHPRFQGRSGDVVEKQGNCYKVSLNFDGKQKMIVVHPVHLRRV